MLLTDWQCFRYDFVKDAGTTRSDVRTQATVSWQDATSAMVTMTVGTGLMNQSTAVSDSSV